MVHGVNGGLPIRQLIDLKRLGGDVDALHPIFGNAMTMLLISDNVPGWLHLLDARGNHFI